MARPSPAPSPSSVPRWNRSNSSGRCSGAIPGPLSSTARLTVFPGAVTSTRGPAAGPGVTTSVVDQYPAQAVGPPGRRLHQHGTRPVGEYREVDTFGLGHGREPLHGGLSQGAEVYRLVDGYRGIGVEPGQEEQVFDDAAEALALGADLAQRAPVARAVAG